MAKVKPKKRDTFIDMTAMSDVTVLLLTFFMLTATFKAPEPIDVNAPMSVSETKVDDYDVMTVLVGKDGTIYVNMDDKDKVPMLDAVGRQYGYEFDSNQRRAFKDLTHVCAPMGQMVTLLSKPSGLEAKKIESMGVPADSADNQLRVWLRTYKQRKEAEGIKVSIAVKADKETPYPAVDKVMKSLVDEKINRYNLVTSLKAMPDGL